MHVLLERPNRERHLGDDAGDALGVGDEVGELVALELADLAGRQHDARRDDVVLELPVLVAAEAGPALREPSGDRRRRRRRGVEPQVEAAARAAALEDLPDGARPRRWPCRRSASTARTAAHAGQVDDDGALDGQHAAVAGRGRAARHERQRPRRSREAHDLDDLGLRPSGARRRRRAPPGTNGATSFGSTPMSGGVHLPLDAVGPHPVADDAVRGAPRPASIPLPSKIPSSSRFARYRRGVFLNRTQIYPHRY